MKAHILIVEDEAVLYERLRRVLVKENYTVDDYTTSVDCAIARINKKRPNIVLLDINLQGEKTGIELGRQLYEVYNIPFIYVTEYDDNETFFKGLHTKHEQYIVKTKPRLNSEEILRAVQTVLMRHETKYYTKEGVIGSIDYPDKLKEYSNKRITRVPVKYENIAFFTTMPFINKVNKIEHLRANFLWFQTQKRGEYYLMKISLNNLQKQLPYYFVRVSDSYLANISSGFFNGRINGTRLSIMNTEIKIGDTYRKEVKKRIEQMYLTKPQ
jgi:DNA-binding response OmpR family regulator